MKKKVLLVDNYTERRNFEDKVLSKSHALRVVMEYVGEHIEVNKEECFKIGIKKYTIDKLTSDLSKGLPSWIPVEKVFELKGFSLEKFQFLLDKYNQIEVKDYDALNNSAPIPDFNIYATEEDQIKRYNESNAIATALNNVNDKVQQGMMVRNQLAGIIRVIAYDQRNNTFKINVEYVLKGY